MLKYVKGKETKNSILEKARLIFNKKGISLTLDALVREMEITKSRLTNHYPTKEALFKAILASYELQFRESIIKFHAHPPTFKVIAETMNEVMDIQFEYRSAIIYAVVSTPFEKENGMEVNATFKRNSETIKKRLLQMTEMGLLKSEILEPEQFDAFVFQYTTLLTTWVIPMQMYHSELSYPAIKPLYIKATMSCYVPYLTKKGQTAFQSVSIEKFNKITWKSKDNREGE